MADDIDSGSGSKDRATVALVFRAVDDLGKTVDAEFRAVNARLDAVTALPAQVSAQHEMLTMLQARMLMAEERLDARDADDERREGSEKEFRRIHRPTLVISALALLVAAATLAAILIVNLA